MIDLARRGTYALPLAGILTALPWVFILSSPSGQTGTTEYARGLTSTVHEVASDLYLAGFICLLFGLFALFGQLAGARGSSWAAGGLIASVVAIALLMQVLSIFGLASAVLGDVYLSGHKDVSAAMVLFSGGTLSRRIDNYLGLVALLSLLGAIANAVAIWRSRLLPRWAGIVVGAGIVLSLNLSPGISWAGALCLVIGGAGLARRAGVAPAVRSAAQKAAA
jgi:hypothetical protein